MAKCILEDRLGIQDKGTVQEKLCVETRRKQIDQRRAPMAKQSSRHLRVERPLGPYNLILTAEEIGQNTGLPWKIPCIKVDVETLRPPQATGQRAEGAGHRSALLVDGSHNHRVAAHCGLRRAGTVKSRAVTLASTPRCPPGGGGIAPSFSPVSEDADEEEADL